VTSLDAICDVLADNGYAVCMPSMFGDKPFDLAVNAPDDGDFEKFNSFAQDGGVAWFQQQSYDTIIKPIVQAGREALQAKITSSEDQPIMMLGFCYGTWVLCKASADFDFKAAVGCHPATALETAVYQGDEIAMLKDLRQPTLFLWAGNDSKIFVDDGEGKKALEATGGGVEEFPDMLHGWVSRGDVGDVTVKRDVERAMSLTLSFLDSHAR
jgi:dienelactone hydrolase